MKAYFPRILGFLVGLGGLLGLPMHHAQGQALPIDTLHWWTSSSERKAVDVIHQQLRTLNIQWSEQAVIGGVGGAAMKVLNSRILVKDIPDAALLQGDNLAIWADNGLLQPLTAVAQRQGWENMLFPTVQTRISYQSETMAAPIGIHRINTLFYNRRLFQKIGLTPPKTWTEFEAVAKKLLKNGIKPLAWSDEPWQIATVFEAVLLSEAGPALYDKLLVQRDSASWLDHRVELALLRLRWLRTLSPTTPTEKSWSESTKEIMNSDAAMLIMGDWAKGELTSWGASPELDFGCSVVPGTEKNHLYSIDTLAMLITPRERIKTQEKVAEVLVSVPTQLAFNRIKGSVPVRQDLDAAALRTMDSCARDSWNAFAAPATTRVPSLTHRMVGNDPIKNAFAQTLLRFVVNPAIAVADAQKRLSVVIRAPSAER